MPWKKNLSTRCATKYCRNKRAKKRSLCERCRKRAYREKHPVKAYYHNLCSHARKRKLRVEFSFEEFEVWAFSAGFFTESGRDEEKHIDRRDGSKNYTLENIQVLSANENIVKGNRERHSKYYKESRWSNNDTETPKEVKVNIDIPF